MNRLLSLVALITAFALGVLGAGSTHAQTKGTNPVNILDHQDAYISSCFISSHHARSSDVQRLEQAARDAANKGVPEKFALVCTYPGGNIEQAASSVRDSLGFSGVVILVAPTAMALASDRLSQDQENSIAQRAGVRCSPNSYVDCALFAGQQSLIAAKSGNNNGSGGSHGGFWLIILAIVGAIAFFAFRRGRREKTAAGNELEDLRRAASNTLSQADSAVEAIERETDGGKRLAADQRAEYDRALGLRDTAKTELERGTTAAMLTQANQDAADAVLAMQGVMRKAGIQTALSSPLETPGHRCFYCGRSDRPPYTKRTISDNKGNSMEIEVCEVDEQRLQQGQQPQVATVNYGGSQVPWYAVPNNPWYYSYGGPTWQYWVPMILGMEMGSLFSGGWGGGYYGGGVGGFGGGYGGGYDVQQDPSQNIPSDAGGFSWGGDSGSGWGGDSGGGWGDSGGGGWDSGGGDGGWGGDSGGGDSGWS